MLALAQANNSSSKLNSKKEKHVSSFVKAGVALEVTALIDMVVAFSTSYWATWKQPEKHQYGGYGLWKIWSCTTHMQSDGEIDLCNEKIADLWSPFPGWYVTTQVFMSLALTGIATSLALLLLYIFHPMCQKNRKALSTLIGLSYLSGLFIVVSLFIFGFKVAEEIEERQIKEWFLSWSLSLAITSLLLNQVAASILITENKRLLEEQTLPDCLPQHMVNDESQESEDEYQHNLYNTNSLENVLVKS